MFFQDDDEEPGQGPRNNTDLLVERLKRVHDEFMEKSNDYDKIHNEVVQSEQVGDVFLCRPCMHYVQEFLVTQYILRDATGVGQFSYLICYFQSPDCLWFKVYSVQIVVT